MFRCSGTTVGAATRSSTSARVSIVTIRPSTARSSSTVSGSTSTSRYSTPSVTACARVAPIPSRTTLTPKQVSTVTRSRQLTAVTASSHWYSPSTRPSTMCSMRTFSRVSPLSSSVTPTRLQVPTTTSHIRRRVVTVLPCSSLLFIRS